MAQAPGNHFDLADRPRVELPDTGGNWWTWAGHRALRLAIARRGHCLGCPQRLWQSTPWFRSRVASKHSRDTFAMSSIPTDVQLQDCFISWIGHRRHGVPAMVATSEDGPTVLDRSGTEAGHPHGPLGPPEQSLTAGPGEDRREIGRDHRHCAPLEMLSCNGRLSSLQDGMGCQREIIASSMYQHLQRRGRLRAVGRRRKVTTA